MEFQDILKELKNGNNDAGIAVYVHFADHDDIETFPSVSATPLTPQDLVTVTGNFVMKPGKRFIKLYCTLETGSLASTMAGERDGRSAETLTTLYHPTNRKEIIAMLEWYKNRNIVAIVQELDGQARLIGSEYIPAEIQNVEITTGTAITDRKGATITLRSIGRVAPVYEGTIPTSVTP